MSKVEGLDLEQFRALRNVLSYSPNPQAAYYTGGRVEKRYLLDKKGEFMTGLLPLVSKHLKDIPHTLEDHRKAPEARRIDFKLIKPLTPYPEQNAIVEAARQSNGTISAPTGFGKSITMVLLVKALGLKTLIIVPNLTLRKQLKETFTECFGSLDNITIENIDSNALNRPSDHDLLIIDEAHHTGASTYRKLNKKCWKGIYKRVFFTATPFRSRDEEQMLFEGIAGQVIHRVTYQTAVNKGYLVPLEAYYIEIPSSPVSGYSWPEVYSELVVNNARRNKIIATLLKSLNAAGKSTLCLVKEIKHGDNICHLTQGAFANGVSDDCQQLIDWFSQGKLKTLTATTGVAGEGVDTRAAEYVIIAGLGKSKNALMQSFGRSFRKFPGKESAKVILILDKSHKWSLAHFKAQVKILKDEFGIKPIKIDVAID